MAITSIQYHRGDDMEGAVTDTTQIVGAPVELILWTWDMWIGHVSLYCQELVFGEQEFRPNNILAGSPVLHDVPPGPNDNIRTLKVPIPSCVLNANAYHPAPSCPSNVNYTYWPQAFIL